MLGTVPEVIDQIRELILEYCRISANCVHRSWRFVHAGALREVGPEMPERVSRNANDASRLGNF